MDDLISRLHRQADGMRQGKVGPVDDSIANLREAASRIKSLEAMLSSSVAPVTRNAVLTEAAAACDALAKSYDNEHNRNLGTASDMASIAEDCAEEIRNMRVDVVQAEHNHPTLSGICAKAEFCTCLSNMGEIQNGCIHWVACA